MLKTRLFSLCIALTLFVVAACESVQVEGTEKPVIYENEEAGIQIFESGNWILDAEVTTEPFNATFKQDDLRVIVSIIPSIKTLDQIKKELNLNGNFVEMINETEESLSFKLNQTENTRSDLFVETSENETLVLTFFTPENEHQTNVKEIEEFRKSILRLY
ncbi:hypothetical protein [Halalkalibacter alkalisediminis]|uniref:DUF1795 domain-containing protein n=1 Tax=Halalkalibacter alkalisediminis TaxID=935616 RepID=A0ABV6NC12_9BACI|nr:hypothetical protein [Halalkalibacter alkalisediminis]